MGPELITNGSFTGNADGWTLDGGDQSCVYDSNRIIIETGDYDSASVPPRINQVIAIEHNVTYEISLLLSIPNYTDAHVEIILGSSVPHTITTNNGVLTTYTFNLIADTETDSDFNIYIKGRGQNEVGDIIIDGVSVRSLVGNLYLQTTQLVGAETGEVQTINAGKSDDGVPLYYELQTQEIEFGNRAHLKSISDKITVLTEFGIDSSFEVKENRNGDFKPIQISLNDSVNIGEDINLEGNHFTFKWSGESSENSPIFKGFYLEKVTDLGITKG